MSKATALSHWISGADVCDSDVLERATSELAGLLSTPYVCSYGFELAEERLRLSFLHTPAEDGPGLRRELAAVAPRLVEGYVTYDPRRPQPRERNRLALAHYPQDRPFDHPKMIDLIRRHGFATEWQARFLACDGEAMLAWIGALRDRPFDRTEQCALVKVARALQSLLVLQRRLRLAPLAWHAMEAALESLGTAAVVARSTGVVLHANSIAKSQLEQDRSRLLGDLTEAMTGRNGTGWQIRRLPTSGAGHVLAIRVAVSSDPSWRVERFRTLLRLTPRQAEVLQLVASGESNKGVAARLGCSEGAVEQHVTALLRRFGRGSRAELLAHFWSVGLEFQV